MAVFSYHLNVRLYYTALIFLQGHAHSVHKDKNPNAHLCLLSVVLLGYSEGGIGASSLEIIGGAEASTLIERRHTLLCFLLPSEFLCHNLHSQKYKLVRVH